MSAPRRLGPGTASAEAAGLLSWCQDHAADKQPPGAGVSPSLAPVIQKARRCGWGEAAEGAPAASPDHRTAPPRRPCRPEQQTAWEVVKRHIYLKKISLHIYT